MTNTTIPNKAWLKAHTQSGDNRPILSNICVNDTPEYGKVAIAADGHRLAMQPVDDDVANGLHPGKGPIVDGEYPDYLSIVQSHTKYPIASVEMDSERFFQVLCRMYIFAREEGGRVDISVRHDDGKYGKVTLHAKARDIGDTTEILPCHYKGPKIDMSLECRYLLEAMKGWGRGKIPPKSSSRKVPAHSMTPGKRAEIVHRLKIVKPELWKYKVCIPITGRPFSPEEAPDLNNRHLFTDRPDWYIEQYPGVFEYVDKHTYQMPVRPSERWLTQRDKRLAKGYSKSWYDTTFPYVRLDISKSNVSLHPVDPLIKEQRLPFVLFVPMGAFGGRDNIHVWGAGI